MHDRLSFVKLAFQETTQAVNYHDGLCNQFEVKKRFRGFERAAETNISVTPEEILAASLQSVGELGVKLADQLFANNDEGLIMPPFSEKDLAVLGASKAVYEGYMSSGANIEDQTVVNAQFATSSAENVYNTDNDFAMQQGAA